MFLSFYIQDRRSFDNWEMLARKRKKSCDIAFQEEKSKSRGFQGEEKKHAGPEAAVHTFGWRKVRLDYG